MGSVCLFLILASVCFLNVTADIINTPLPSYGPDLITTSQESLTDEGVTRQKVTYVSTALQSQLFNFTTNDGYVTKLYRGDIGYRIVWYHFNGSQVCDWIPYPTISFPPPPYFMEGLTPVKHSYFDNKKVVVWRYYKKRYIATAITDADTGILYQRENFYPFLAIQTFTEFHNNTTPDPSVFTMPSVCGTKPPPTPSPTHNPNHTTNPNRAIHLSMSDKVRQHVHEKRTLWKESEFYTVNLPRNAYIPREVDNTLYASPIRNQGNCGACWAFAATASTEIAERYAKKRFALNNASDWLSVQSVMDCTREGGKNSPTPSRGCDWGWPPTALQTIIDIGIATELEYPYDYTNGRYCRTPEMTSRRFPLRSFGILKPGNISAIEAAIYVHGAVAAVMYFPFAIAYFTGDVFSDTTACTSGEMHAVTVVGYTESYWVLKNSFGASWGNAGYVKLVKGVNACGMEDNIFVPIV
eukprot:PhF_6_TR6134/c1_g1_i1/m.9096/K01365/CTSL; cathepsin L